MPTINAVSNLEIFSGAKKLTPCAEHAPGLLQTISPRILELFNNDFFKNKVIAAIPDYNPGASYLDLEVTTNQVRFKHFAANGAPTNVWHSIDLTDPTALAAKGISQTVVATADQFWKQVSSHCNPIAPSENHDDIDTDPLLRSEVESIPPNRSNLMTQPGKMQEVITLANDLIALGENTELNRELMEKFHQLHEDDKNLAYYFMWTINPPHKDNDVSQYGQHCFLQNRGYQATNKHRALAIRNVVLYHLWQRYKGQPTDAHSTECNNFLNILPDPLKKEIIHLFAILWNTKHNSNREESELLGAIVNGSNPIAGLNRYLAKSIEFFFIEQKIYAKWRKGQALLEDLNRLAKIDPAYATRTDVSPDLF